MFESHADRRPARRLGRSVLVALALIGLLGALALPEALASSTAGGATRSTPTSPQLYYGGRAEQAYDAWIPPVPTTRMAVVTIHGGSWVRGSTAGMAVFNQRLYALGIPSFSIDYRRADEAPWPAQNQDVVLALADIRSRAATWGIDPNRIALIGSSAGGHLALSVASIQGRSATCAVVAYSPPTSIALIEGQASRGYREQQLARHAAQLATTRAKAPAATLPVTPSRTDAPALLFAGSQEWVLPENSRRYVAAYRHVHLDVRLVIRKGDGRHANAYAGVEPSVWTSTMSFIDKHC